MKQKTLKTSKIKINAEMKLTMPRSEKIAKKYEYTKNQIRINRKYGRNKSVLQSPIILDKKNVLIDGYTSYLIAKMFDIKKVDVIYSDK